MAKIMLVEDDNNLREIYEARLLAEGYEIVSAKDGEEALALAVKEKPDLIISDVMMPKISGFDMLDILRSTPETKDTKVIMMTALSQAEDKTRADKLGADRYLVKSQVTLEDVAKVAKEVLSGEEGPAAPTEEAPAAPAEEAPASKATETTTAPEPPATTAADPAVDPDSAQTSADEAASVDEQINQFVASAPADPPAAAPADSKSIEVTAAPADSSEVAAENASKLADVVNDAMDNKEEPEATSSNVPVAGKKVISPINDLSSKPDLDKLAAEQEAKDTANDPVQTPTATSVISPEGSVVTPAEAASPDAAPKTPDTPPKPGEKIDPNSVAL
jgi:DNA-binding response OmpR family regulator